MSGSSEFLPVPVYVLARSDVSWPAKVLLGALYAHERRRRTEWPYVEQIAEEMRAPRRSCERWLSQLVDAGLVTSIRDGRLVRYAPARTVGTGELRDLERPSGHPPEVADVDDAGSTSEVADVEPSTPARSGGRQDAGHPPHVADVSDGRPPRLADVDVIAPLSDQREGDQREIARARVREIDPVGIDRGIRGALVRGYQRRYRERFSDAWMSAAASAPQIDTVTRYCAAAEEPLARVDAVLDGAFRDPWMTSEGRRVPWGAIAKDPARYANGRAGHERAPPSKPSEFTETPDSEITRERFRRPK